MIIPESNWTLPDSIIDEAKRFFEAKDFHQSLKFIKLSRVSISFKKGTPETYFIVSGIVKDDRTHECKISYKKRLEGSEEGPLSSNCDCIHWNAKTHCSHVASLFLTYHLQHFFSEQNLIVEESEAPPIAFGLGMGVTVEEYGTMINGPHHLVGSIPSASYSGMQYLLHSKKVIPFPLPKEFIGKVLINVFDDRPLSYRYENHEGKLVNEISLLENLYLFNWRSGECFHLSNEMKIFFQKVKINQYQITVDELIQLIDEHDLNEKVDIVIDGEKLHSHPNVTPRCRINIEPSEKKAFLKFQIQFHDEKETLIPPPEFLWAFTFTGGHLQSFKKKQDCYEFIQNVTTSLQDGHDHYKKNLISSHKKSKFSQLIYHISRFTLTHTFDRERKLLITYENQFLRDLFLMLVEYFKEPLFRFAEFQYETRTLNFEIQPSALFQGLNEFFQKASLYGVQVFYDRAQISKWSSRIKFERRASSTKWFDLEMTMSHDDWQVIKEADLETGVVVTKQGMILLSNEQKDLLRFMQKYTKYEGTEDPQTKIPGEHKFVLPFTKSRIFELFELRKMGIDGALTEEEIKICERLATLESVPDYPLSEHLTPILRPYQKTGYNWLKFLYEHRLGGCLADDMGLGKTLQTIAFLESIYSQIDKVLVVCPVSILINWEKEIEKFSQMKAAIYHGGERKMPENAKIILTSYGIMKREIEDVFSKCHFDVLVLDEVQHLKNLRSLGAFSARKIQADFRLCLTGTPVENDLSEFYNIIDLCLPGIWGDLQFVRTTSTTKSRLVARKTAAPFILRRTKGQVLHDLPPKTENNVYLEFSEDENQFYKDNLVNIRNRIHSSQSTAKYGEILRGLLLLRQNCLWQSRNAGGSLTPSKVESTKIEFLIETLEQIIEEGHQAIVFSQFTTYLDIIEWHISQKHWKFSRIDGSQTLNKRQEQVELFQGGKTPVFLISLKAGGVGLNLTAASYVFVMDPWWNPAVEQQAIDRAHRIGQKNNLTVYRPIIKGSVEEKVLKLQEEKRQLFYDLLPTDDEQVFSGKLSMKDFELLLS